MWIEDKQIFPRSESLLYVEWANTHCVSCTETRFVAISVILSYAVLLLIKYLKSAGPDSEGVEYAFPGIMNGLRTAPDRQDESGCSGVRHIQ